MRPSTTTGHPSFPMPRRCPLAPPAEYAHLRSAEPVSRVRLPTGGDAWVITRHEDVRTVLGSAAFSADGTRPGFPALVPGAEQILRNPPFIRMDPPRHTYYRRMLSQEFALRRIRAMRPGIQATVDRLLDDMLDATPPVDMVAAFALPLPSLVICQLLGVPYEDHEFFQGRSAAVVSAASTAERSATALGELRSYMDALVSRKQVEPRDDLMSRLVTEHLEPAGGLGRDELLMMCLMLLNAGHETTANMISLGTVALLEHPEQLAALIADPALFPAAVEELLRHLSIADLVTTRIAAEDVELGGARIREGDPVIALLAAADWDPAVFAEPERLDIGRGDRQHVAFGYGVHQCIGQNLARLELGVALSQLFARVPTLRVAVPVDELRCKRDGVLHGLHELPVAW